jgi:hypothetical protein
MSTINSYPPLQDLYDTTRALCIRIGHLIGSFAIEDVCNDTTCPDMKADQWQYLCASHPKPNGCSALNYCIHTLDTVSQILTSPKHFPSRFDIQDSSILNFQNIFRRLYRVFAHIYFEHTSRFYEYEHLHGLYRDFLSVITTWDLVPGSSVTIPQDDINK